MQLDSDLIEKDPYMAVGDMLSRLTAKIKSDIPGMRVTSGKSYCIFKFHTL